MDYTPRFYDPNSGDWVRLSSAMPAVVVDSEPPPDTNVLWVYRQQQVQ